MSTIDIIDVVRKQPDMKLSETYQNRLLQKIQKTFTEVEQELYVTSFYCYLHYTSKDEFVVDFDKVWKWLGFSRKGHAKIPLIKHFVEGNDYIIIRIASEASEANKSPSKSGSYGSNRETIMLTVNTFKKFCLKAGTAKADEIHDYYIKAEALLHETMEEETTELRKQLEAKDKKSVELTQQLEAKDQKSLKKVTCAIVDSFNCKKVVYVADIGVIDGKNTYKFGVTDNVAIRIREHKKVFPKFELLFCIETVYNRELERVFKNHKMVKSRRFSHTFKVGGKETEMTELVEIDDKFTIHHIKKILQTLEKQLRSQDERLISENNAIKAAENVKAQIEITKQKELEIKVKELEIKAKEQENKEKELALKQQQCELEKYRIDKMCEEETKQLAMKLELARLSVIDNQPPDQKADLLQLELMRNKLAAEESSRKAKKMVEKKIRTGEPASSEDFEPFDSGKISLRSTVGVLKDECRRLGLSDVGVTQIDLYNRIQTFLETGEKKEPVSYKELKQFCIDNNLPYTGEKTLLEERIKVFKETGERVRYPTKKTVAEEIVPMSMSTDYEKILAELSDYTYDKLVQVSRKYRLITKGRSDELRTRLRDYLLYGTKSAEKRRVQVYTYDSVGNFIKHYNSVAEARVDLGLPANTVSGAVDKPKIVNGYIFRSTSVVFKDYELENMVVKKSKPNLTKTQHAEIKRLYESGESKASIMEKYEISNTQFKRLVKKPS